MQQNGDQKQPPSTQQLVLALQRAQQMANTQQQPQQGSAPAAAAGRAPNAASQPQQGPGAATVPGITQQQLLLAARIQAVQRAAAQAAGVQRAGAAAAGARPTSAAGNSNNTQQQQQQQQQQQRFVLPGGARTNAQVLAALQAAATAAVAQKAGQPRPMQPPAAGNSTQPRPVGIVQVAGPGGQTRGMAVQLPAATPNSQVKAVTVGQYANGKPRIVMVPTSAPAPGAAAAAAAAAGQARLPAPNPGLPAGLGPKSPSGLTVQQLQRLQQLQLLQRQQQQQQQAQVVMRQQQMQLQARQAAAVQRQQQQQDEQEGEQEEGDQDDGEIYAAYRPAKVTGPDHPDIIVETASLASVTPPDPKYKVHPVVQEDVDAGLLSSAQLETLIYANMRFNGPRLPGSGSRAGFFLGDGAGVGKGRQIAAAIKEYWLRRPLGKRRVLWISTSADLRFDARRDLADIKAEAIDVIPKAKDSLPKNRLSQVYPEGVMFVTYSLLAMSTEVPGVRNGPLAQALKLITDPTARAAAGSTAAASSEGGGRGRGRGRGRSGRGGRGGRGSMSRGGSASQLAGADDEEQSGSAAAVDGAVDGEAAEGEEQEEEEATGRRGRKKGKKISWKRAPGSAVERAAGELYAAQVAVGSRLWQIVEWLAEAEDGEVLIVLDECHRAKNLLPTAGDKAVGSYYEMKATRTGLAVLALQNALPNARVLYSSATGAAQPTNLAYLARLLPVGFKDTMDMVNTLRNAGLGSLELFCMGLKATGSYLARTLSYHGAEFTLADVQLSPQMRVQYDRACEFWQLLIQVFAKVALYMDGKRRMKINGQMWSSHQRFFRQMLMASKVPACAQIALDAVYQQDMCVVIGLQSTGEASMTAARAEGGDEMDDLLSAPRMVLSQFVEKWFPGADSSADAVDMKLGVLNKLLLDVYRTAKKWEGMPNARQLAEYQERLQLQAMKRRARSEAAAAGAAVPPPLALTDGSAAAAAAATAAAAGDGLAEEMDGMDVDVGYVEVVADLDLDRVLRVRRETAARAGMLIDLSTEAPEDELEAANRALDEQEAAEADRARFAALAAKRQALENKLLAANAELEAAKAAVAAAKSGPSTSQQKAGSSAAGAAKKAAAGKGPSAKAAAARRKNAAQEVSIEESEVEDSIVIDEQPQTQQHAAAGRKRRRYLDDSEEEEDVAAPQQQQSPHSSDDSEPAAKRSKQQKPQKRAAAAETAEPAGSRPRRAAAAQASKKQRSSSLAGPEADSEAEAQGKPSAGAKQQQQQQQQRRQPTAAAGPRPAEGAAGGRLKDLNKLHAEAQRQGYVEEPADSSGDGELLDSEAAGSKQQKQVAGARKSRLGPSARRGHATVLSDSEDGDEQQGKQDAADVELDADGAAAAAAAAAAPAACTSPHRTKGSQQKERAEQRKVAKAEAAAVVMEVDEQQSDEEGGEEEDDTDCTACGLSTDGDHMLLCDGCDAGWHIYCLDPPLEAVPDGDWFCPECTAAGKAPSAAAGAAAAAASADSGSNDSDMQAGEDDGDAGEEEATANAAAGNGKAKAAAGQQQQQQGRQQPGRCSKAVRSEQKPSGSASQGGRVDARSAARALAAKKRLKRATDDLAIAQAELVEFDKQQQAAADEAAGLAAAAKADAQALQPAAAALTRHRITRGSGARGTVVIDSAAAAGALPGYKHSTADRPLKKGWEKELDEGGKKDHSKTHQASKASVGGTRGSSRGRERGRATGRRSRGSSRKEGGGGNESDADDESETVGSESESSDSDSESSAETDSDFSGASEVEEAAADESDDSGDEDGNTPMPKRSQGRAAAAEGAAGAPGRRGRGRPPKHPVAAAAAAAAAPAAAAAGRLRSRSISQASTPTGSEDAAGSGDVKLKVKDEEDENEEKTGKRASGRGGRTAGLSSSRHGSSLKLDAEDLEVAGLGGYALAAGDDGGDQRALLLGRIKKLLLRMIAALELPANPLDDLIEQLGGETKVAEMTGRKGLLVRRADGKVTYKQRSAMLSGGDDDADVSQKMINIQEKDYFMRGEKLFAIISDAASTGISLQADKRVANQRRRCHITLELPWSADKAIQQFGRSHRSNQSSAPVYHLMMTPVGGERRFAGAVAKRLQSLGALLQGDRRAVGAGQSLKEFDIDNKWGKEALVRVYDDVMFKTMPMPGVKLLDPLDEHEEEENNTPEPGAQYYSGNEKQYRFFRRLQKAFVRVGLLSNGSSNNPSQAALFPGQYLNLPSLEMKKNVPRFLNRLLGLSLAEQHMAFGYFQATFDAVVAAAKSRGDYDRGIQSIGAPLTVAERKVLHKDKASGAETSAVSLSVDYGFSFADAQKALEEAAELARERGEEVSPHNGFYVDKDIQNWGGTGHPRICLVVQAARQQAGEVQKFRIRRPNNGWLRLEIAHAELRERHRQLKSLERAELVWNFWYKHTEKGCVHGHACARRARGDPCNFGGRKHEVNMLSGAVLPIWKVLHEVTAKSVYGRNEKGDKVHKAQVQRGKLQDGTPIIGMTMLPEDYRLVINKIEEIESLGGVEALARQAYGVGGIWGEMEGVWVPEDDDEAAVLGLVPGGWRGGADALDLLRTLGVDESDDEDEEGEGSSDDDSESGSSSSSGSDDEGGSADGGDDDVVVVSEPLQQPAKRGRGRPPLGNKQQQQQPAAGRQRGLQVKQQQAQQPKATRRKRQQASSSEDSKDEGEDEAEQAAASSGDSDASNDDSDIEVVGEKAADGAAAAPARASRRVAGRAATAAAAGGSGQQKAAGKSTVTAISISDSDEEEEASSSEEGASDEDFEGDE